MQIIKKIGLYIFLIGLAIFTILPFMGGFKVTRATMDQIIQEKGISSELFIEGVQENVVGEEFQGMLALSSQITRILEAANARHRKDKEYKKVVYIGPHDMAAAIGKASGIGFIV